MLYPIGWLEVTRSCPHVMRRDYTPKGMGTKRQESLVIILEAAYQKKISDFFMLKSLSANVFFFRINKHWLSVILF